MEKIIDSGQKICIWPENMKGKDINEMILNGYNPEKIVDIINSNTFTGIAAKVSLTNWKKN